MKLRSLLVVLLLLCTSLSDAKAQTASSDVLAAWSQISGSTVAPTNDNLQHPDVDFRFVTKAQDCSAFSINFNSATKTNQPSGKTIALRSGSFTDVRVCSLTMGSDWLTADLKWNGQDVHLTSMINKSSKMDLSDKTPTAGPSNGAKVSLKGPAWIGSQGDLKMVTLGDTGCRGTNHPSDPSGRSHQNCDWGWPLDKISSGVVGHVPHIDLAIHVGDYRYFFEFRTPDTWTYWNKDFFPAAQPLLLAAPWVFIRGNHESCTRNLNFGSGYFQLFGGNAGEACPANRNGYMKPYYFDVQPGGVLGHTKPGPRAHRFVVIDVNNDLGVDPSAKPNFDTARKMVAKGPASSWWAAHTPGVELLYYGGSEHKGDRGVRAAMFKPTDPFCPKAGACQPNQILLGHQHLYQSVTFSSTKAAGQKPANDPWVFPRIMIVGHGGTKTDSGDPSKSHRHACLHDFDIIKRNGTVPSGYVETHSEHGLVIWTRKAAASPSVDQSGWSAEYLWSHQSRGVSFEPVPVPTVSSYKPHLRCK